MNFAFQCWPLPALLVAGLFAAPGHAAAAPPLLVTFQNNTGQPATGIYIGFVGGDTSELVAKNVATGKPVELTKFGSEHWYYLNTLGSGISLTKLTGGRIYVGFGTPWHLARAGYEPSPSNPNDPAYLKRYDKMEMTYTGAPADVADTTSIDYFSIPIALKVYRGGTSGTLVASVTGGATNTIVAAVGKVTTSAKAAIVRNPTGDAFVRAIGPGTYPPPPGLPASPYNNFQGYLTYLQKTYAPAHKNVAATIKGHFAGVGPSPTTPETKPQNYDFTATIDAGLNITLAGSGAVIGKHTLLLTHDQLVAPSGIYGANPSFSLDGAKPTNPVNDVYGWIIGDLLSGLNVGAVGSTATSNGVVVGELPSQSWFKLTGFFASLQAGRPNNYNRWAATLAPLTQAYNFAYSDRFAHVFAPLNPGAPQKVDTLQIIFLNDKPPPGPGN